MINTVVFLFFVFLSKEVFMLAQDLRVPTHAESSVQIVLFSFLSDLG